jgi:prolyl-tRNA synthetase
MRRSTLFTHTLREHPAEAETAGHALLLRGGYIQPVAAGIYSLLPLGYRVKAKIEAILREEMEGIGGQELSLPVVLPAEIWQESGRWYRYGVELVRFTDRARRDLVLAMTHEEVIADLIRRQVRSYRQLPLLLYQIQTKFRDEPRARAGLIRTREFVMKDAYSAHASTEDLDRFYPLVCDAYLAIFRRGGLPVRMVEADVGMMGGSAAHEFMYLSEIGEDQLLLCDGCGYAANRQIATFRKHPGREEAPLPIEKISTPETPTIAALAQLLSIPESRTAKAAFFVAGDRFIFAVVRGDMEVNEAKLAAAVGVHEARPARAEEVAAAGIVAGYASPIGVTGTSVVVDDVVPESPNLVAGANEYGFHLLHTNVPRDYRPDIVADIADADAGAPCSACARPLRMVRGVEVGNTFKLGTTYSRPLQVTFLDAAGEAREVVMASYGIGVGRLMACIAQEHSDECGLRWPVPVAPFHLYLVALDLDHEDVRKCAEAVYAELTRAGVETLYDDRAERPGVKFNDADLLGMPLRLTVSRRSLDRGGVELKERAGGDSRVIPASSVPPAVRMWLDEAAGTAVTTPPR